VGYLPVIPAPMAYSKVVAVKTLVAVPVDGRSQTRSSPLPSNVGVRTAARLDSTDRAPGLFQGLPRLAVAVLLGLGRRCNIGPLWYIMYMPSLLYGEGGGSVFAIILRDLVRAVTKPPCSRHVLRHEWPSTPQPGRLVPVDCKPRVPAAAYRDVRGGPNCRASGEMR